MVRGTWPLPMRQGRLWAWPTRARWPCRLTTDQGAGHAQAHGSALRSRERHPIRPSLVEQRGRRATHWSCACRCRPGRRILNDPAASPRAHRSPPHEPGWRGTEWRFKFVPGWSPAAGLEARTIERLSFGLVGPELGLPVLAAWETLIGVGLLSGRYLRFTLLLLFVQMPGTMMPLVLFPEETFLAFRSRPRWKASTSSRTCPGQRGDRDRRDRARRPAHTRFEPAVTAG